jgi:DegV family protein with EDD domain
MLRIVTDGAADMPEEWLENYQINILPLRVNFGEKTYTAGINLKLEDFYRLVHQTRIIPKTSLPSPQQVADFYRSIAQKGDEILSIHITSRLSGTYNTILKAAEELRDEYKIYPFDSGAGSIAQGYMCRDARLLKEAGKSTEQILSQLSAIRERMVVYFTVDNLEFAYLSGRVNALQNALSSILKVKPIIVLRSGLLEMAGKVRTRQRAIDHVIQSVKDLLGGYPANIAVVHAEDPEAAQDIFERLHGILNIREAIITDLAIPVAANLGPRTVGIVAYRVDPEENETPIF